MATNQQFFTFSNPVTTAEFRAICQFLANTMETGGIVKTAGTGQADLATINFPSTNNTAAGYEIRRFSDSLQASAPVFIKFEYGRGTQPYRVAVFITIGTGSDGAGNITNIRFPRTGYDITSNVTSLPSYISAGASWVVFTISNNNNGYPPFHFSLERAKTSTGADSNRGLYLIANGLGASDSIFIDTLTGTSPPNETLNGGVFAPTLQTSGLHSSGNVAVYPYYFFGVGETMPPSRNIVGGFQNDFTGGSTYSVQIYGQTQTMIRPLTGSQKYNPARGGAPSGMAALIRWE